MASLLPFRKIQTTFHSQIMASEHVSDLKTPTIQDVKVEFENTFEFRRREFFTTFFFALQRGFQPPTEELTICISIFELWMQHHKRCIYGFNFGQAKQSFQSYVGLCLLETDVVFLTSFLASYVTNFINHMNKQ